MIASMSNGWTCFLKTALMPLDYQTEEENLLHRYFMKINYYWTRGWRYAGDRTFLNNRKAAVSTCFRRQR